MKMGSGKVVRLNDYRCNDIATTETGPITVMPRMFENMIEEHFEKCKDPHCAEKVITELMELKLFCEDQIAFLSGRRNGLR